MSHGVNSILVSIFDQQREEEKIYIVIEGGQFSISCTNFYMNLCFCSPA